MMYAETEGGERRGARRGDASSRDGAVGDWRVGRAEVEGLKDSDAQVAL
jgi:hypothetical protein